MRSIAGTVYKFHPTESGAATFQPCICRTAGQQDSRLNLAFQDELYKLTSNPRNGYISYDQLSNRLKGGIGVEVKFWQRLSGYASLAFSYAGIIPLGCNWTLSPALKVRGEYLNYPALQDYGPTQVIGNYKRANLILMPGILLNLPKFFVGVSVYGFPKMQLYSADIDFVWSPGAKALPATTLNLQVGYRYAPRENWSVSASVVYMKNGYWGGDGAIQAIFRYKPLLIGGGFDLGTLFYSNNGFFHFDKFVSLGYKHKRFRVLASYTFSRSYGHDHDSWEIGVSLYFPNKLTTANTAAN